MCKRNRKDEIGNKEIIKGLIKNPQRDCFPEVIGDIKNVITGKEFRETAHDYCFNIITHDVLASRLYDQVIEKIDKKEMNDYPFSITKTVMDYFLDHMDDVLKDLS